MGRFHFDENFSRAPKLNATLAWPGAYAQAASVAIETANKDFEIIGTNAADADSVNDTPGLLLRTAGAGADQMIVKPQTDTGQSEIAAFGWWPTRRITASWAFLTDTSIVGQLVCMGFRPTATLVAAATALDTTTDNDKFLIRALEGTDTNFQLITSVSGTETTVDSGIAFVANTNYSFTISVGADSTITFISQNVTTGAQATVKLSTVVGVAILGVPFFGIEAAGAAVEAIHLARMRASANAVN